MLSVVLWAVVLLPYMSMAAPALQKNGVMVRHTHPHRLLAPRQGDQGNSGGDTTFQPTDENQAAVTEAAEQGDYVKAAQAAEDIPGVQTESHGNLADVPGQIVTQDGQQYPWFSDIPVTSDPVANGDQDEGWQELPQIPGFTLNDTFMVWNSHHNESGVLPYYIAMDDPGTVERFVVVLPGKVSLLLLYDNTLQRICVSFVFLLLKFAVNSETSQYLWLVINGHAAFSRRNDISHVTCGITRT